LQKKTIPEKKRTMQTARVSLLVLMMALCLLVACVQQIQANPIDGPLQVLQRTSIPFASNPSLVFRQQPCRTPPPSTNLNGLCICACGLLSCHSVHRFQIFSEHIVSQLLTLIFVAQRINLSRQPTRIHLLIQAIKFEKKSDSHGSFSHSSIDGDRMKDKRFRCA
jgi:hypothetical protein